MTDNKFFTWVWRFNGVALALGLILIVSALSWNTISSWSRDNSTVIPVNPAQPADRNDPSEPRTWLGPPTKSAVAGVYALPQFVQQEGADWVASKGSSGAVSNLSLIHI